ncbi:hypothetical protein ACLMJK_001120 [Lecanora helva]
MFDLVTRATTGVTGALPYDPVEYCILAAGTAIAWAYTIELDLVIFYTFRRRKGLYFWALLICSWGCSLHALGFILKFLVGTSWAVDLPFIEIGWVAMVTGQAFVLYSRLHLVVRNQQTLQYILAMIIFDAFALHLPTIIFTCGSNSPNSAFWTPKFNIMERIQLVGFCVQEFIISTVYITSTVRLLGSIYHSMTRKVMIQLLCINFICIGMDIILIGLEFTNNYVGEAAIKPMIYAIKLKLEFAVLNQLMGLTKAGFTEENQWRGQEHAASHELRNRTLATKVDAEAPAERKTGGWATTGKGFRTSLTHPEQIFQTHHVDVVSEPKTKEVSNASSSTAVAVGELTQPPPKVKSLMGTPIVHMPGRARNRPDPEGRNHSPSESEKEIFRKSTDSEKEGTRWIEGDGHDL